MVLHFSQPFLTSHLFLYDQKNPEIHMEEEKDGAGDDAE
jgi:hypothetical protein